MAARVLVAYKACNSVLTLTPSTNLEVDHIEIAHYSGHIQVNINVMPNGTSSILGT